MTEEIIFHYPERRFLPEQLWDKGWTAIDDPTCLEAGDWIFDPASHAYYAGQVQKSKTPLDRTVSVSWHKSPDNIFQAFVSHKQLSKMWWADPALQEA